MTSKTIPPEDERVGDRVLAQHIEQLEDQGWMSGYERARLRMLRELQSRRSTQHDREAIIEEFDANVDRLKACEHIADGDDGWERLRNECPSTAAVARLRDEHDRQREEIGRLREALMDATAHLAGAASAYRAHARRHITQGKADADPLFSTRANDFDKAVARARSVLSDTTRERSADAPTPTGDS